MQRVAEWVETTIGLSPETQVKVWASLIAILILGFARRVILKLVSRRVEDVRVRYQWQKTSGYITALIGALLVGRIWFEGLHSLATYLGLLSAGLAIALKDLIVNLAGWSFILWRRPFEVGDRIQMGDHSGDVIDIRIFQFSLLEIGNWVDADQSTGRIIHVPNGKVFTEPQANYTKGFEFIWNEIPVLVTFESDWKKAKEILHRIVATHAEHLSKPAEQKIREASEKFMIFYKTLTPTVYTSVKDSGVLLTIRYLCEPRRRRGSAQAIWEDILQEFAACSDIDFAYPTQRFYDNRLEGKAETRPTTREEAAKPDKVEIQAD